MSPKRVQMSRQRPWRTDHPDAVIVARPSKWGNPFVIGQPGVPDAKAAANLYVAMVLICEYGRQCVVADPSTVMHVITEGLPGPIATLQAIRSELRGRDLACWCPLDEPCHADVLLMLANEGSDA